MRGTEQQRKIGGSMRNDSWGEQKECTTVRMKIYKYVRFRDNQEAESGEGESTGRNRGGRGGGGEGLTEIDCPVCFCCVLRDPVTCTLCLSVCLSFGVCVWSAARVLVSWQHTFHGNSETHARVSCVLFCFINTKTKPMSKNKLNSDLQPNTSHLVIHSFLPFIHLTHHLTQVFFSFPPILNLNCTLSSPTQLSSLFHQKSLHVSSPALLLSLRAGPLQHA